MTLTLALLAWSTAILALYIGTEAAFYWLEYGPEFASRARDNEPPAASRLLQRSEKALRNFLETYPAFIALGTVAALAQLSAPAIAIGASIYVIARILYLPAYLSGIPYLRSTIWLGAAFGLALMFLGIVLG